MLQTSSERQKTTSDSNQRTDQHSLDVGPASSSLISAGDDDDSLVLKDRESTTGKPMISDCITVLVW